MNHYHLRNYGLNDQFEQEASFFDGYIARVTEHHHHLYKIVTEQGELQAAVSGKLLYGADGAADFPAVGDWVVADRTDGDTGNAVIRHILRRRSAFVRKAAGTANAEQIVAANIDMVFLCMSLNEDFNLRRLERYLAIAWDSRATPVIVLTKADLCPELPQRLAEIASVSVGTEVIVCSCVEENGWQSVRSRIGEGQTAAFIGSSGVGKSTLINLLMARTYSRRKKSAKTTEKGVTQRRTASSFCCPAAAS